MISRHIELAVARSFVNLFLCNGSSDQMLSSRSIAQQCAAWRLARRLYQPSFSDLTAAMTDSGYQKGKSNGQRVWHGVAWTPEPNTIEEMTDADVLRRLTQQPVALPLRVFCELARVGRSTFYVMSARGDAPPSYRKGRRVFIGAVDAVTWCAERGMHGAVLAIVDRAEDQWADIDRTRKQARG